MPVVQIEITEAELKDMFGRGRASVGDPEMFNDLIHSDAFRVALAQEVKQTFLNQERTRFQTFEVAAALGVDEAFDFV